MPKVDKCKLAQCQCYILIRKVNNTDLFAMGQHMIEEFLYKNIVESTNDSVIVTDIGLHDDKGPKILYVNPAFSRLSGYCLDQVIGESPRILQGPDTGPETRKIIRTALERKEPLHTEILNYTKTGKPYWIDLNILPLKNTEGVVSYFLAIVKDLTGQKRLQHELHRLEYMDALTGIANRQNFMVLAETEFYRAKRYRRPLSSIMFDLDNFQNLNKLYGHQFGDEVLKTVAENCRTLLRQSDIFGRIGGEKFAIILPESCLDAAEELADRLCMLLCVIQLKNNTDEIPITASFGVTTASPVDAKHNELLERVDIALYEAKSCGGNTVRTKTVAPIQKVLLA